MNVTFVTPYSLLPLDEAKQKKKDDLSVQCNLAIEGNFTSSALGTVHTYPSDGEAQTNFNTECHRFLIDPTYTSCMFKTIDAGYLPHNRDQFFKVFADGHDAGVMQLAKLNKLKSDVDAVTSNPQLDTITW
jgi:hypothetical protein